MLDKLAGLATQVRDLKRRLKEMDAKKADPAKIKEITDVIKDLEKMLEDKKQKQEERKKKKEEAVKAEPAKAEAAVQPTEVVKESAPVPTEEVVKEADVNKFAIDSRVEPIRGTAGSVGVVIREAGVNGDPLVYVKWTEGALKQAHGEYGAYYPSDLKLKAEEKKAEVNPNLVPRESLQKLEADLKGNYERMIADLKEELETAKSKGELTWVGRLEEKLADAQKDYEERFGQEKQADAKCKDCLGSGHVIGSQTPMACPTCNGTGIEKQAEDENGSGGTNKLKVVDLNPPYDKDPQEKATGYGGDRSMGALVAPNGQDNSLPLEGSWDNEADAEIRFEHAVDRLDKKLMDGKIHQEEYDKLMKELRKEHFPKEASLKFADLDLNSLDKRWAIYVDGKLALRTLTQSKAERIAKERFPEQLAAGKVEIKREDSVPVEASLDKQAIHVTVAEKLFIVNPLQKTADNEYQYDVNLADGSKLFKITSADEMGQDHLAYVIEKELLKKEAAYGDKRDHKKIEIFVDGKYKSTTTWAKTCAEAKEKYLAEHKDLKPEQVKCQFKQASLAKLTSNLAFLKKGSFVSILDVDKVKKQVKFASLDNKLHGWAPMAKFAAMDVPETKLIDHEGHKDEILGESGRELLVTCPANSNNVIWREITAPPATPESLNDLEAAKQSRREWAVRLDGHKIFSTHATEEEAIKALDAIPSHMFIEGDVVYRDIPENEKESAKECSDCHGNFVGKEDEKCPSCGRFSVEKEAAGKLKVGDKVRISELTGINSGKTGTVTSMWEFNANVGTNERGVPNIEGYYKPVDWSREVPIKLDDGSYITMFKNRLFPIASELEASEKGRKPSSLVHKEKKDELKIEELEKEHEQEKKADVEEKEFPNVKMNSLELASRVSPKLAWAGKPEHLGEWRWTDKNDSSIMPIDTLNGHQVWLLLSAFEDGSCSYKIFSDKYTSELNTFENIIGQHFIDQSDHELQRMVESINDDLNTIDRYAESWEENNIESSLHINAHIRHENGKWVIYSHDYKKKLGTYDSKSAATKRLREIEYFKHQGSLQPLSKKEAVQKEALENQPCDELGCNESAVQYGHNGVWCAKHRKSSKKEAKMHKLSTGEADQDYDKKPFDEIVKGLAAAGYKASHREFDKYQGVYIQVSGKGINEKLWVSDGFYTGVRSDDTSKYKYRSTKLIDVDGNEFSANAGDYWNLDPNKKLEGLTLIRTLMDGTKEEIENPTKADLVEETGEGSATMPSSFTMKHGTEQYHLVLTPESDEGVNIEYLEGSNDVSELVDYLNSKSKVRTSSLKKADQEITLEQQVQGFKDRMSAVTERLSNPPAKTADLETLEDLSNVEVKDLSEGILHMIDMIESKVGENLSVDPELHPMLEELENKVWEIELKLGIHPDIPEHERLEPEHKQIVEEVKQEEQPIETESKLEVKADDVNTPPPNLPPAGFKYAWDPKSLSWILVQITGAPGGGI